ncbi:MAG: ATP-binding protein, partial [Planctomycetota bacterium]
MSKPLNITIIEDDDDARSGLVDILELDDHVVTAFSTATAAKAHGFFDTDVVLMDRRLPDGMAEDMLPEFRTFAHQADFIVITGYADMQATIAALREGVYDYLIKPIDHSALSASLARLAKRRATERELYRQRRFAEKLLDTAEAIVLVLDAKGRVMRANRFLLELTGYQSEEVIGADWFDLFIPEPHQEMVRRVFEETVNQMNSRGILNPVLHKNGEEKQIRWSNSTLKDVDGQTMAVLAIGLDVTDLVEAQTARLQAERLATIGTTVTGLAHESRNALQRMQNAVDLLKQALDGQPELIRDVEKIERGGQHIRNLLEEVRDYAAPIRLARANDSLENIWRRAWQSVSHRRTGRTVTLEEQVDDEVPTMSLDASRLEQVFRNLFENAFDAVAGDLAIEIETQVADDQLVVYFRDNGPGVPASHRDKLFDAFATSKPKGTGLGLAICKRIIEAHGGTMR